ncbi:MAG: hypothetical protein QNJ98_16905 [Planctomycetota bacterium]|nr:hypothetical protein [Planctomycetota bacterium]
MKTSFRAGTMLAAALVLVSAVSALAEDGDGPKGSQRWMLKLERGHLKTVLLEKADGSMSAYHYITLKVTNGTNLPRPWNPLVKAITDTKNEKGEPSVYVASGYGNALMAIRRQERNSKLENIGATAGKIGAGETIDGVAIFGPLDSLYDRIDIEVHGLANGVATYEVKIYDGTDIANDTAITPDNAWVIVDSAYWDRNQAILKRLAAESAASGGDGLPQPTIKYVVMQERRYWGMTFERLGDEFRAEDDLITFKGEGWMIQGNPKKLRTVNEKAAE